MSIFQRLAALSDPTRVRILKVLEQHELGVGELVRVLSVPQSTVSRHVKVLRKDGWLSQRSAGPANLLRLVPDGLSAPALKLWAVVRDEVDHPADQRRLASVLALRRVGSREFFGRQGAGWDAIKQDLYGSSFELTTLLALLAPELVVADLGCGTGTAAVQLAAAVHKVIAVDREQVMLDATRVRAAGRDNVDTRLGELDALPLQDGEADVALCMLVLHHVARLPPVFAEVARVLRPGGRVVVLDLQQHDRAEYRLTMGHEHQGFAREQLEQWASAGGLQVDSHRLLPPEPDALGPQLFLATLSRSD